MWGTSSPTAHVHRPRTRIRCGEVMNVSGLVGPPLSRVRFAVSSTEREVEGCWLESLIIKQRYERSCAFASLGFRSKTQTQVDDGIFVLRSNIDLRDYA